MASSSRINLVTGVRLKYSIPQLLNLNNYTVAPACIAAIKGLGLLRRPRYSSRRKFVYHHSGCSASEIPFIWTDVARLSQQYRNVSKMAITARLHNAKLDRTDKSLEAYINFALWTNGSTFTVVEVEDDSSLVQPHRTDVAQPDPEHSPPTSIAKRDDDV
ncbi:hypothetical protein G5714_014561 [Onychostoma macrolepis]|uniref:Uncharacterized protein n=1 Tax=Onychostoma macrolepis TaxID=369639 RepID=A0A7J6CDE5_9TELE|nr:hypothetical protein G5714_014561 [Onychostoma macrolepis]